MNNIGLQLTWLKKLLSVIGYQGMQSNNLEGGIPSNGRVINKTAFRPSMKKIGVYIPKNLPRNKL